MTLKQKHISVSCIISYPWVLDILSRKKIVESIAYLLGRKNLPPSAGDIKDMGLTPGSGRSPGGGLSTLQYSCLENPKDRGAWWTMVHRVVKSWT